MPSVESTRVAQQITPAPRDESARPITKPSSLASSRRVMTKKDGSASNATASGKPTPKKPNPQDTEEQPRRDNEGECLCQWFVNNKRNKTCPDCRAPVNQQPAPAYLVREMTETFIARHELMPPGETKDEHRKWQQEESDIVERDKVGADLSTGGLFKGCFKSKKPDVWAIRDDEDGVQRCPTCAWEIEDGECGRCGLIFDEDGRRITGEGFSDLSEDDDQSGTGFSSEDLDEEIDMEDQDGELGSDWYGYDSMAGDEPMNYPNLQPGDNYAIRRAIAQGAIAPPPHHRSAAHSAAAGRRRSSRASIVSGVQVSEDEEMGTLAEESEEDDEADETLNGFLVHDESDQSQLSSDGHVMQRLSSPRQRRRGNGVLSESLTSGSQGRSTNNEDGSDEGGAVSSGRRRRPRWRPQTQLQRRLGRRGPIALSVSTDADEGTRDLSEDTQALLQSGWSPLDHGTAEDGVSDFTNDGEDDAMTTVGIPPSISSSDRARFGGSLTPTAEASTGAICPHSRIRNRNGRVIDGSRGLRRRSSILSVASSTLTYEDGEADDDDSDEGSMSIDRDGDVDMEGTPQRNLDTRSTDSTSELTAVQGRRGRVELGASVGNAIDLETDSTSDTSVRPIRRRRTPRSKQPAYNPLISAMFAQHQSEAQDVDSLAMRTPWDHPRSRTPIIRPRTANRNRVTSSTAPTQAPPFSPLSRSTISPSSPIAISSSSSRPLPNSPAAQTDPNRSGNLSRQSSTSRGSGNSVTTATYDTPSSGFTSLPNRPMSGNNNAPRIRPKNSDHIDADSVHDEDRRLPLLGHGTPVNSANDFSRGRDLPASTSQGRLLSGSLVSPTPGLNYAARSLQARNPWAGYVRPRQSSTRIREQSSTATLRPYSSRRELRGQPSQSSIREEVQPYTVRPQSSRTSLRSTPSHQRLRGQAIVHPVSPVGSNVAAAQRPMVTGGGDTLNGQRNVSSVLPRLSQEERQRRGNEVVRRRAEELERRNSNPFTNARSNRSGSTSRTVHASQQQKMESHRQGGQSQGNSAASPSNA
ncbi:MAG: hypothetical protein M1836_007147 [Candelina mexicana]|nr:MAG: hypothetical protein M1836_007147 [Candelina mexicana]